MLQNISDRHRTSLNAAFRRADLPAEDSAPVKTWQTLDTAGERSDVSETISQSYFPDATNRGENGYGTATGWPC